ncbi:hypothetical protein D3C81_1566720 [compost metagenome]
MPAEEWCKRWVELNEEREKFDGKHDFTYQNIGATYPVVSGDTPIAVPGGLFEFIPK